MTASHVAAFAEMAFCHEWRDYQADVLRDLSTHLDDRKLHVAAAPGAGKTVLGLEVMRRIGKPTLILAPSIAIRNQWVDRLFELFLPDQSKPDWITTDLQNPRTVTVATYQALYTDSDTDLLAHIGVVVLDEAHHLRKAWWERLDQVVTTLDAKTVSLTATPPYDVSSVEWQRYHQLCGPLDAEINIPELVKSGDLAPHQDLVHHSKLLDMHRYADLTHQNDVLRAGTRGNDELCDVIEAHAWIMDTRRQTSALLSDPELFSAMLVYLADAGRVVPKYALRVLGVGQKNVPPISDHWLQTLCQGLLADLPDAIIAHLTKCGAIYRGRVSIPLRDDEDRQRILRNAAEKYDSVRDITRIERAAMGADLRLAILSEHVGASAVKLAAAEPGYFAPASFRRRYKQDARLGRLNAGSIFERLRLETDHPEHVGDMAVLTGSLCIVPAGTVCGEGIAAAALPHDPRYEVLTLSGIASDHRVRLVSDLLEAGKVRVLIGTRALLGQGWDAPSINTLILATNVKSFVSSNQIRGRAIRRDPRVPTKAANIWHIATAAPTEPGPEIEALQKRFDTFVHLDTGAGQIRSGFTTFDDLDQMNAVFTARATERSRLGERWQNALVTGSARPHIRHRLATPQTHRGLVRTDAAAQIIPRVAASGAVMGTWAVGFGDALSGGIGLAVSAAVLAPGVMRLKRVIDHGTIGGSLRQTGFAVIHAMRAVGRMTTPREGLEIEVGTTPDGFAFCNLEGATLPEETRFLAMLEELFAPIENPRYVLIRQSYLRRVLQLAPYAVPRDLGKRKGDAQALLAGWNRYVGPAELVYTRTVKGRLALLQSRTVSLAEARTVKRSTVWE